MRAKIFIFFAPFFKRYFLWIVKKNFQKIHIIPQNDWHPEPGKSLIVWGNHTSWWDGFWALHANEHYLHKRFGLVMLEHVLRKTPVFYPIGAIGIRPGTRAVLEDLTRMRKRLKESNTMLIMYPQGVITSPHCSEPEVKAGAVKLLEWTLEDGTEAASLIALTAWGNQKKPELYLYLYPMPNGMMASEASQFFKEHLEKSIEHQKTLRW